MNKYVIASILSACFFMNSAQAVVINLTSNMDCAKANAGLGTCGTGGSGTGTATMTYDTVTRLLNWNISLSGTSGTVTLAHFHGPALPNANAGIAVTIGTPPANPDVGSATLTPAQEGDLLAGRWYINIHSSNFPNGEIRGQVNIAPTCDIQLSQASYIDGDSVTANVFRFTNLSTVPIATEIKIWLGVPGFPPVSVANIGSDGSIVFPAGMDIDYGPIPLFPVTAALPRGTYEYSCRMLDPVTGEAIATDINVFDVNVLKVTTSVPSTTDSNNSFPTGSTVRIDVAPPSSVTEISSGTIRITSQSQNYDSGEQPLLFGSAVDLWYLWDSTGLPSADDYVVTVTLLTSANETLADNALVINLEYNLPAPDTLAVETDLSLPSVGVPVQIQRTYSLDLDSQGILGYGWAHNYGIQIIEQAAFIREPVTGNLIPTDAPVQLFEEDGSNSYFYPNGDGSYQSPKGDFRSLSLLPGGDWELRSKSGMLHRFSANGKLARIEDPNGNAVLLQYDGFDRLDSITDASAQVTTISYDANDRIWLITDALGRSSTYDYDADGNLVTLSDSAGIVTSYSYDTQHNLVAITDAAGQTRNFTIYPDGRLESISDEGGTNQIIYLYGTPAPDQMTVRDSLGNETISTFNDFGLPVEEQDALGNTRLFAYDNDLNQISQTDANGNVTTHSYDARGNVLSSVDGRGNTVSMTYEPVFNQMTSLTDSNGNTTTFSYDANGNKTSTQFPDGATESLAYNPLGQVASKTDRLGQTISFGYDYRGLLTNKSFPDGSSDNYVYNGSGILINASDENGAIEFTYDQESRFLRVTYPGGKFVSYAYDASGNRTRITYPDGTVIGLGYDATNRLVQVSEAGQVLAAYSYDSSSRITRRDLGNGTFSTYAYDAADRLLSLTNTKSTLEVLSSYSYTYDSNGNRLTMTTLAGTTNYAYDADGQLTQVILPNGSTITYGLDPSGNRTQVTVDGSTTSYTTNNRNQYTNVEGDAYTYDANGNLSSKTTQAGVTTYSYDFENQLIEVTMPTDTVTYSYDPLGRRISKTSTSGTTNYFHDDQRVILETDETGAVLATYIFGIEIDEVLIMRRAGSEYYYLHDGLGSVTEIIDQIENLIESYSYDTYGVPANQSSIGNQYLFTGREFEPETNNYYYRARYYNPETGTFITEDPIGLAGGINLYTYVRNNPVNLVDPTGLFPFPRFPRIRDCVSMRLLCDVVCNNPGCPPLLTPICDRIPGNICAECKKGLSMHCRGGKNWFIPDPTFIQACQNPIKIDPKISFLPPSKDLQASISVPGQHALVRGEVPIFGIARGEKFASYRVEYGTGKEPIEWTLLTTSDTPREDDNSTAVILQAGDWPVDGNLATLDTGLKNYVYLPSHPEDHPVDLKGIYTIRLVVNGVDGGIAEDRVTVDVANVIPNALGGKATSGDGKAVLSVREQALMDPFRLISVKQTKNQPGNAGVDRRLIGEVYEFREASENFVKPAELQLAFSAEDIKGTDPGKLAIYAYDEESEQWLYQQSHRPDKDNVVIAEISRLQPYYALMASDIDGEGSALKRDPYPDQEPVIAVTDSNGHYLVFDSFEESTGEWSNRDNVVGAEVALDDSASPDGTRVLSVTNTNAGGNFAVNVLSSPFDVRDYPIVEFDYQIFPGVKTNFLVKVAGRWYEVRFTDDRNELARKNVNIASIGDIEGIVADGQWRRARFNLFNMLRTKTGNAVVEEIIMADWNVPGFMTLAFGQNEEGATYYIDNFSVRRESESGLRMAGDIGVIDNFNKKMPSNRLGYASMVFSGHGGRMQANFHEDDALGKGHSLSLTFDVTQAESFAGYQMPLSPLDLREFQVLSLYVRSVAEAKDLSVGLKDPAGNESWVSLSAISGVKISPEWQRIEIPLAAFTDQLEWSRIDGLTLAVSHLNATSGEMLVDQVEFRKELRAVVVNDYERNDGLNRLGRHNKTVAYGAAAVNGFYATTSPNKVLGLAYGGNIGDGFLNGYGLSYSYWRTELGGINCSQCEVLSFKVRVNEKEGLPNIYLGDGNNRWGLALDKFVDTASDEWQDVEIPLQEYSKFGVDVTHLVEMDIVFEWKPMSGTIYIDDIKLGQ